MKTAYTTQIRIQMCVQCGAPLETGLAGGTVSCQYCRASLQVRPRDEQGIAIVGRPPVSEEDRINRLRMQDGKPIHPPQEIMPLIHGGKIPDWKVTEAVALWQATRRELSTSANPQSAERLLFLAMLLAQHLYDANDTQRQRALLESSLDVVFLPRHKQVLRGFLARSAARQGDVEAAEGWLAPCDQLSDDLETDTAYRYTRAYIDTVRGDYAGVLRVLGQGLQDVPIMDMAESMCIVLRANAWERLGRIDVASQQLAQLMLAGGGQGRRAVEEIRAAYPTWRLCEQSFAGAMGQYSGGAAAQASARSGGGVGAIFFYVGAGLLVISIGLLIGGLVAALLGGGLFAFGGSSSGGMMGGGVGFTLLITGGSLLPVALPFAGIGYALKKSAEKAARIRLHGLPGTGTVVSMQPTGMAINNVPQMQITLNVQLDGRAPYQASTKMLMHPHQMAQFPPGASLPVRVDPQDPSEIVIEA